MPIEESIASVENWRNKPQAVDDVLEELRRVRAENATLKDLLKALRKAHS